MVQTRLSSIQSQPKKVFVIVLVVVVPVLVDAFVVGQIGSVMQTRK